MDENNREANDVDDLALKKTRLNKLIHLKKDEKETRK